MTKKVNDFLKKNNAVMKDGLLHGNSAHSDEWHTQLYHHLSPIS